MKYNPEEQRDSNFLSDMLYMIADKYCTSNRSNSDDREDIFNVAAEIEMNIDRLETLYDLLAELEEYQGLHLVLADMLEV